MTEYEEAIEKMARAICAADGNNPDELVNNAHANPSQLFDYPLVEDYRANARAAAEAIGLREMMEGWRPIQTAPRDGTRILLSDGKLFAAGHWGTLTCNGKIIGTPSWWWDNPSAFNEDDQVFPDYDGDLPHGEATHWMPMATLPAPLGY